MSSKSVSRFGVEVDLSYEHKTGCPWCMKGGMDRSGNNLHVYGMDVNGKHRGAHCFAQTGHTIPSEEYMEKSGFGYEYNEEFDSMGQEFNKDVHDKLKSLTGIDSKNYRGIPTEVSKYFGTRYEYSETTGEVVKSYYPITKNYEISGYKIRAHPKDFRNPFGEVGRECDLVGQFRFKTHSGICVIVGGEIDQLSAYAMLKPLQKDKKYDEIAVVSSSVGESATFKQVQGQYEWLNQFKKIIICMDNDEAGKAATEALAEVLPKGKVYVMNMRRKDPNSYIWDKDRDQPVNFISEFVSDFWAAKPYTPEGVKSASEAFDEIEDELSKERITLPNYMHKMQEMMGGGVIQGRILNIIGDTSGGKSTHINRMVYHWIYNSPVIPTIVSLEATAGQYMLEMLGVHLQKNMRWSLSDSELIAWLKTPEGQAVKQDLCFYDDGTPRFYLIDNRDKSIKELEAQMEKLNKKHGSKLFVIDVLSDLLRGTSEDHAEDHMNWQRNMVKSGVTIANVLHTRKPGQTTDGKTRKVTEFDALGSGTFIQSAAYNIVINRDKLAEDALIKNTTEVDLPKCRGGKTGPAGGWYYDFMSVTCYDLDDYKQNHPEKVRSINF